MFIDIIDIYKNKYYINIDSIDAMTQHGTTQLFVKNFSNSIYTEESMESIINRIKKLKDNE